MSPAIGSIGKLQLAEILEQSFLRTRFGDRALHHGTCLSALPSISRNGIMPRGKGEGNWRQTIESNPTAVYLTNCYGLYFALHAMKLETLVILEVDIERIEKQLQADEDAVEQSLRGKDGLPAEWDMVRRTSYYRNRAHQFRGDASLATMGTCSHRGTIDSKHIKRVAVIEMHTAMSMVMVGGIDPFISVLNYKHEQDKYRTWSQWLFDGKPDSSWIDPRLAQMADRIELDVNQYRISRAGIRIYESIALALQGEKL